MTSGNTLEEVRRDFTQAVFPRLRKSKVGVLEASEEFLEYTDEIPRVARHVCMFTCQVLVFSESQVTS